MQTENMNNITSIIRLPKAFTGEKKKLNIIADVERQLKLLLRFKLINILNENPS